MGGRGGVGRLSLRAPPPADRPAGQGRGDPFGRSWNFPKSGTRPKSADIFIEFLLFVVGAQLRSNFGSSICRRLLAAYHVA